MNLLFVIPYAPNLIRVRPFNIIRSLADRGHRITLLSLYTSLEEQDQLADLEKSLDRVIAVKLSGTRSLWNCLRALPTKDPLQAHFCWHPDLERKMLALLEEKQEEDSFHLVHVEHLRGARYGCSVLEWRRRTGRRLPVVWDSVDSISLLFELAYRKSKSALHRGITLFELARTRKFEQDMIDRFDRVLVTSSRDREKLLELASARKTNGDISVVQNGVDLDYFGYASPNHDHSKVIVMTGKMSYHANISMVRHFYEEIFPIVRTRHPDAELWIVGKDPSPEISAMQSDHSVTVTGTVPDIRPYFRKATVAVTPVIYSAGIQNKVLEAMAAGIPVVSSPDAVAGIQARPDVDLLVADEPKAFAAQVSEILERPSLRESLSRAGRNYVEVHHAWSEIAQRLESIYDEVVDAEG